MLSPIEIAQAAILAGAGIAASASDIRLRIIPNWLSGLLLVGGLAFSLAAGGWPLLGSAVLHFAVALVGGMVLFAAGFIGGGDAKYYAAIAAWFSLRDGLFLFVCVALCGLFVLVGWFLTRRLTVGNAEKGMSGDAFAKLPYGVAISLGAVVSALTLAMRS